MFERGSTFCCDDRGVDVCILDMKKICFSGFLRHSRACALDAVVVVFSKRGRTNSNRGAIIFVMERHAIEVPNVRCYM